MVYLSKRLSDRKNYNGNQQEDRDLVKPAVPHMAFCIAVVLEILDEFAAVKMVSH